RLDHAENGASHRAALRWLIALPRRALVDTVVLVRALLAQLRGRAPAAAVHEVSYDLGAGASEAVVTILVSMAPNHYVIGVDRDRHVAVVHALAPRPVGSLEDLLVGA